MLARSRPSLLAIAGLTTILAAPAFSQDENGNHQPARLNQIQVIATHNSYHVAPEEPRFSEMVAENPRRAAYGYSHAPLDVQLDRGVRGFELDVY